MANYPSSQEQHASQSCRIAVAGLGTIARAQHLPVLAAHPSFTLAATIDPLPAGVGGTPHFNTLADALAAVPGIAALAICTPPQWRHAIAREALSAGLHVLLEKPPCTALGELRDLEALAHARRRTLFTAWHAQYAAAVEPARRLLLGRAVREIHVTWREDVRDWHPGQDWIWQPGGLGVFDPGINALSIICRLLAEPFWLKDAWLDIPSDCATPIAARLLYGLAGGGAMEAVFDWRGGGDARDIVVTFEGGDSITLTDGGHRLATAGGVQELPLASEYRALYGRFLSLMQQRKSDVDDTPLQHAADAFLRAQAHFTAPFGRERA